MWYFIALCLLAVNAENNTDSSPQKDSASSKVEPKNISSLYIGDLLRTKAKEDLTAAGSVHQLTVLNEDLLSASNTLLPYKSHGGHEYSESEYHPMYSQGNRATPSDSVKRTGLQAQNVPFNVKGHILTLKPVRLVSGDNLPTARNPERRYKETHYPGDDCSKNNDRSYSSEEKPYVPEKTSYRSSAKQTASNPELEYRSPPRSYYDDSRSETYSSHSDSSPGSYNSKTYPSNTNSKSQSSGSYTTSKSTSTSKTVIPNTPKVAQIVPTVISNKPNYEKTRGSSSQGDQGYLVYKTREPSNQKPGTYSESSEKEYPPPDYDREHKPAVREPHYSQHSSGGRKSRKFSHGTPAHYSSSEPKERPQQYGPPPYEEDQSGYDQSTYSPDDDHHYREQNGPSTNNNENKYAPQYSEREPENKPYHQSYQAPSGEPAYYSEEPKTKPHQTKKQLKKPQYEKQSNHGREQGGYRTRGHSTSEYDNPHEHQPSRGQSEVPQHNYETYPAQYGHEEVSQAPQSYDRTQPARRPTEKQPHQYEYEARPHQTNTKQSQSHSSHKRPYRESSRYARSPQQPTVVSAGNAPVVMVSRESKPYVSRSESFSESSYDMGADRNQKANYGQQKKFQPTEGRQVRDPKYQTSYKPYNSEYPASYANDQHHGVPRKHAPRAYGRPTVQTQPPASYANEQHQGVPRKHAPRAYGRPTGPTQSYDAPVYSQTHSNSEESPQEYQEGPAYDQGDGNDDSYEQEGKPVKKSKNHHYISNIEGYKDTYGSDEPLVINEDFFKKYGISPTAKVIVANAENPNLFVADGTRVKEGEFFENSGPSSGPSYESGPSSDPSYESGPDPGYGQTSSAVSEEENYNPGYKGDYKEDSYSSSPEELGPPKQVPGSFDDLVDTNPKFLRHLPQLMKNEDAFFKMDSTEHSFDDVEFPKVGEQRGYIVSQRPGEIVQQHGDGVSRIVFNVPKPEPDAEPSNLPKEQVREKIEERMVEAATKLIKNIIKPKP